MSRSTVKDAPEQEDMPTVTQQQSRNVAKLCVGFVFGLVFLLGVLLGMNILANALSKETHTDPITGEMFTDDGQLVVRTGVVESFSGLLALLRASPEQLSKLTYAFFATTWLDGRTSWDSWKIASFSRFGH